MKYTLSSLLIETNRETLNEAVAYTSRICSLDEYYLLSRKIKELRRMIRDVPDKKTKLIWSAHLLTLEAVALRLGQLELMGIKEALNNGRSK